MKSIYFYLLFIVFAHATNAQQWQWGKRAGSGHALPNSGKEYVGSMTVDRSGNVYFVSVVYGLPTLTFTGGTFTPAYTSNGQMAFLVSYKCDGTFRWSKQLGSIPSTFNYSIQCDGYDGVYILNRSNANLSSNIVLSDDTTFISNSRGIFAIKYDTSGVFKWVRSPIDDAVGLSYPTVEFQPIDMHVTYEGDVSFIASVRAGTLINGQPHVGNPRVYLFTYDRLGNQQTTISIPFHVIGLNSAYQNATYLNRDSDNNIIISSYKWHPQDTFIVNGQRFKNRAVLLKCSPTGTVIWTKTIGHGTPGILPVGTFRGRPAIDDQNNIYVTCSVSKGDTLDNHVFTNSISNLAHMMPALVKFSPSGNILWVNTGSTEQAAVGYESAINSNNKIAMTGYYSGQLQWDNHPLKFANILNEGFDPFITVFNTDNGQVLSMDSLSGPFGASEIGTRITADSNDNFYIGGEFNNYLDIAGTLYSSIGDNDVFYAKYGSTNCQVSPSGSESKSAIRTDISCYPVPTNHKVFLQNLPNNNYSATILNISGQQVMKLNRLPSEGIDVSHLPKGLYIIQLQANQASGKVYTSKFIVAD
jgi:hypothetical protein